MVVKKRLFEKEEIINLLVVSTVMSIVFHFSEVAPIYLSLPLSLFFNFLREFVRKIFAKKFGCTTLFKISLIGIVISLVLMFASIPFTLLGFTEVYPYKYGRWGFKVVTLNIDEIGYISLASVSATLGIALLAKLFTPLVPLLENVYKVGAVIAFFQLIPHPKNDGGKIMAAHMGFWAFLFIISCFTMIDIFLG